MSLLSSRRRGIGGRGPAHPAAVRGRTVIVGDTRRAAPRLRHRRHRQSTARGTIAAIVSPAPRARPSSGTIPEWWQHLQGWNLRALLNHLQGHQTRRSARILLPARRRASLLTSASPAIPDGHQAPLHQSSRPRKPTRRRKPTPLRWQHLQGWYPYGELLHFQGWQKRLGISPSRPRKPTRRRKPTPQRWQHLQGWHLRALLHQTSSGTKSTEWWQHLQGWHLRALLHHLQGWHAPLRQSREASKPTSERRWQHLQGWDLGEHPLRSQGYNARLTP